MGQYRLAIYRNVFIGAGVEYDSPASLKIRLPFILIHIGLTSYARGYFFFWSNND